MQQRLQIKTYANQKIPSMKKTIIGIYNYSIVAMNNTFECQPLEIIKLKLSDGVLHQINILLQTYHFITLLG